jgi:hypothetical protein
MRFDSSRGTFNSNLNFDGFNANDFRFSRNSGNTGGANFTSDRGTRIAFEINRVKVRDKGEELEPGVTMPSDGNAPGRTALLRLDDAAHANIVAINQEVGQPAIPDPAAQKSDKHAPSETRLLVHSPHPVGEAFDTRPFGNRGEIFQMRDEDGHYRLFYRSHASGETALVWVNDARPVDMDRDYGYTLAPGPFGIGTNPFNQQGTPLATRLNEVAEEVEARAEAANRPGPRPLAENRVEGFLAGAAGATTSVLGDTSAFIAGVAPYFTIDPAAGMFNDPAVQGLARDNSRYFNQAVMDQLRGWMMQVGIAEGSAEFEFGLNAMRVVGSAYSAYRIGHDALSLALRNGNVRIVVENNHVLRRFRNLADNNVNDVARFIDSLSPEEVGSFDPRLRAAMIEGLERQRGNATARAALNRLRNLEANATAVAPDPRLPGTAGSSGPASGAMTPPGRAAHGAGAGSHLLLAPGDGNGIAALVTGTAAQGRTLRQQMEQMLASQLLPDSSASIQTGYRSWDDAGAIAGRHNAGADPQDIVVRLPVLGEGGRVDVALARGDAFALLEMQERLRAQERIPSDFDIGGAARQLGVDWEAARQAAAQARVFDVARDNPITYAGARTFAFPDPAYAAEAAAAFNASSAGPQYIAVPMPVLRNIIDAAGQSAPAIATEVWVGPPERLRGFFRSLEAQGRLPQWMTMQQALNAGGLSDSFATREQAGLDLRAAEIEVAEPTTFGGARIGVETGRGPAISSVLEHNRGVEPGGGTHWLYVPLLTRITGDGVPHGATGTTHAIFPARDFAALENFFAEMQAQGRIPDGVGLDMLLAGSGIDGRYRAWREARNAPADQSTASTSPGALPVLRENQLPDQTISIPHEPREVIDFVNERWRDSWETGLEGLPQDALDDMAAGLYGLVFENPGDMAFFREDVERAWRLLIGQGARPFPDPVGPGDPGHDSMPRATDYGLPDRGYRFMGQDSEGHPVWQGPDGRNVRPFSREPSEPFANPRPVRADEDKFPFNPTAPGPLVPDAPGELGPLRPDAGVDAPADPVVERTRSGFARMLDFILDELGVDARIGLNLTATTPDGVLPVTRASATLGLESLRALDDELPSLLAAMDQGDQREIARIASRVIGVGMRVGEGVNEPQLFRAFAFNGFAINSAMQWRTPTLEALAERAFIEGPQAPMRFRPEPGFTVDATEPGFVRVRGRLSLNAERLPLRPGESPVPDLYGHASPHNLRLAGSLPIDKTMFETYLPSLDVFGLRTPSGEYREELSTGLVIPEGTILPPEMVEIIDRAIGSAPLDLRIQVPYATDPAQQQALADDILRRLGGEEGILDNLNMRNVEAEWGPGLRARMSSPPGSENIGFSTVDANFLPMEDLANWLVSAASGGEGEVPFNRAVHGVLDPLGAFAPDSLHGYRDKTRLKITLGRLVSIPGLARVSTSVYFLRGSQPDMQTPLMRNPGRAVVGFADDFGQERAVETPVWLAMMLGRRAAPEGRFEAALGIQPLPPGGIVVPPGGRQSLDRFLAQQWHAASPERREAIAAFIADHMAGPDAPIRDNQTLMPQHKDDLTRLLYELAEPTDTLDTAH